MIDPLDALSGFTGEAWLVGGAVRDGLLARVTADYDVAVAGEGESERLARVLARAAGGFAFALSQSFGAWRVVAHDRAWQLDLMPLEGETIEADLARRDLTVNAIARRLGAGGELRDPFGGVKDLGARRLRMVSERSFVDDPLRTMRLARLACELGFEVEPSTLAAARASAPALSGVAPERVFEELKRVLIADHAVHGLDLIEAAGVAEAVLPELVALRGIEQSRFHHLDVFQHTRAALAELIALQRDPESMFGADAGRLRTMLDEPLANELTRGDALRFGAVLHDIAKAQTRAVSAEGRITFLGHDEAGAELVTAILGRLRAAERLTNYVAALTRNHLRLGFLVSERPLTRRAVYGYLRACSPVAVEVTLLSVADRLATRGDNAERATARHLDLARQLLGEALDWGADPPRPPIRGNQLARALGLGPGPMIGDLLRELEAASFAGEVRSPEEAIEHARQLIDAAG